MDEKPKYFSSTCCKSWLAVNVFWHKWHWYDLSSTLHDEHLYGRKIHIFSIICCRSWLAVNVLWHKWHWNDLSSTLHDEHLYGWKILHRTFQFPDIINFITTRCQQLFAKHLLLNITLFYALLHSFFQIFTIKTPQKPDQYRTRAWFRSGSGPVRSGSGIFQSGPVRFRCNTNIYPYNALC